MFAYDSHMRLAGSSTNAVHHPDIPSHIRDEMSYWLMRPDASLRPYVKSYFVSDVAERGADKLELHMPDGYGELVFVFRCRL